MLFFEMTVANKSWFKSINDPTVSISKYATASIKDREQKCFSPTQLDGRSRALEIPITVLSHYLCLHYLCQCALSLPLFGTKTFSNSYFITLFHMHYLCQCALSLPLFFSDFLAKIKTEDCTRFESRGRQYIFLK